MFGFIKTIFWICIIVFVVYFCINIFNTKTLDNLDPNVYMPKISNIVSMTKMPDLQTSSFADLSKWAQDQLKEMQKNKNT